MISLLLSLSFFGVPILVQAQSAPFHVLRIAAGPAGTESNGSFVLTEERSTFNRAKDKEVLVLFQWEGTPGQHKLEARWRSPDGSFVSTSTIDYTARDRRFGAYWQISIAPDTPTGAWTIEATVDGIPAGRLNFEITDTAVASGTKPRRPLSQPELYERLSSIYVLLSRTGGNGRDLEAAGAVLDGDRVLTAVRALDEAETLVAWFPGGTRQALTELVDVQRQPGWAALRSAHPAAGALPRATGSPRIGDRCYSMDGNVAGARVLLEGQVTGRAAADGGLMVSFAGGAGTMGNPVVNEFGEFLGLLGTTAMPSPGSLRMSGAVVEFGNTPMIPADAMAVRPGGSVSTFEAARARGDLLEPLVHDEHVVSGGFAASITRGPLVHPEQQRLEFSSVDKEFSVFVTWSPRVRLRGETMFRFYDAANKVVASSNGRKVTLRQNELALSSWRIPVFRQPGTYRAELLLDGKPVWRDYVKILP